MQVALATDLAPHLGKGLTMVYLPPPKLLFLRDATVEVRLNSVSLLALLNDVVGTALLTQSLFLAVLDLVDCCLVFN
jgi:hypothetical protein